MFIFYSCMNTPAALIIPNNTKAYQLIIPCIFTSEYSSMLVVFQCKHLLAIKLGVAMKRVKEQAVTDNELVEIIQQID